MMIEQMKPSGIDWIGNIPVAWDCKQIAFMTDSRSGGTPDRDNMEYWENGTIPWMSSGEVNKVNVYETEEKITEAAIRGSSAKIIKANSVMVALNGQGKTKGMSAILRIDSACNQSLCAFSCHENKLHYEYLFWCFQTMYTYLRQMSGDDVRDGLAASYVKKQKIPVPNYNEQKAIATYLNSRCSLLDGIVADLEKQIDTLQKYKKSLITETVTKGLDKSVPMKDIGIEWIGKIPEHWNIKKFSYECERIGDIDHYMPDSVDEGIPYVMTGDFVGESNEIDFENCKQISRQDYLRLSRKMKPMINDILFARYATIGTVRIVDTDKEFLVSYSCAIIRVKKTLFSKYVFYYLKSSAFYEEISQYINTNTQGNVGIDSIGRARIPLPPVSEQELIANFLDEKCTQIDELLQIKQSQLNSIKEHKKSLIYEYVTGKKRVMEVK